MDGEITYMASTVRVRTKDAGNAGERYAAILKRKIVEKCGESISVVIDNREAASRSTSTGTDDEQTIVLDVRSHLDEEGFSIERRNGVVTITGHDERGLLYGIGKLLREASYAEGTFRVGNWTGSSIPDKKIRGIYFASHFHNYYHDAPLHEVALYVEDIALWGVNAVAVWFDMHHYDSISDPQAEEMIERLQYVLQSAKRIGLMTALCTLGNEAYSSSPTELRAEWEKNEGYKKRLGSHYHVELCPNKPGASELMMEWKRELFERFANVGIDFVWFGPYDQGGCTCAECRPWGGNGFLKTCRESAAVARQCLPNVRIIIFAWLYEYFTNDEWKGLSAAIAEDTSWADVIMWDYNTTCDTGAAFIFDAYLKQHGVPGDLPLIGFPEISMFATQPYGGWGANPQPDYMQSIWDEAGDLFSGGFPYSEGIYEDMNKVVCFSLYWNRRLSADDAVKAYIAYEYSPLFVEHIFNAVKKMQSTYLRRTVGADRQTPPGENARFVIQNPEGIEETWDILSRIDKQLEPRVRKAWRWRVLYLRSLIDYELLKHDFQVSGRCEEALTELEQMYYAARASTAVAPMTKRARSVYISQ